MSAESGYQCPKCNFTWESTDAPLRCFNCGLDYPTAIPSRAALQRKVEALRKREKEARELLDSVCEHVAFIASPESNAWREWQDWQTRRDEWMNATKENI